jgi:putative DNA methylase
MTYDRRLIEDSLPLEAISEQSAREKSVRHGHISTLHIWWARRPLTAMRAAIFASLMPAPTNDEERISLHNLLANIVAWDATQNGSNAIEKAHLIISEKTGNTLLNVLDPFMGGGSVAFEALRLQADVFAIDSNPLAYLIGLGTLVYPQRYRERIVHDLHNWGDLILRQVSDEIGKFYEGPDMGYLWTYNLVCSNPTCRATIPLIRNLDLARGRQNQHVALRLRFDDPQRPLYEITHGADVDFDIYSRVYPKRKTVIQCPVCGTEMPMDYLRSEAMQGRLESVPIAAISQTYRGEPSFRVVDERDLELYEHAANELQAKLQSQNLYEFVPNEPIIESRMISLTQYGIERWSDVYNRRQLLQLITFIEKCRSAYDQIVENTQDPEYAKALVTYLSFAVDHVANYNSILAGWDALAKRPAPTFSRQALPMRWDYFESSPNAEHGWQLAIRRITSSIQTAIDSSKRSAHVVIGDATRLDELNLHKEFDLVVADPPFYDNVLYSDLTDYFYVWLKRVLSDHYPEAFRSNLISRGDELVLRPTHIESHDESEQSYLARLEMAFSQIHEHLKTNGILVLLFPFHSSKSMDGIFQSVISAGFDITALWPFRTEIASQIGRSVNGPSTLLVVGRKRLEKQKKEEQFVRVRAQVRKAVRDQLKSVVTDKKLYSQDLLIQAFRAALGVFTQYSQITKLSGEDATVRDVFDVAEAELADFVLLNESSDD